MKDAQVVRAGRYVDVKRAIVGRDGKVRRRQHENYRAHRRMNVAEDADDAWPLKPDGARAAGRVQADVEYLAAIAGKGVMEDGIAVGKVDRGSGHYRQNVRREHLIFLQHGRALVRARRSRLVD